MNDIEYYFDEMCRLCIKKEMPLFNVYEEDSDGVPLLDKIKEVCDIQVRIWRGYIFVYIIFIHIWSKIHI